MRVFQRVMEYEVAMEYGCEDCKPWISSPKVQSYNVVGDLDTKGLSIFGLGIGTTEWVDTTMKAQIVSECILEVTVTIIWMASGSAGYSPGIGPVSVDNALAAEIEEIIMYEKKKFTIDCCCGGAAPASPSGGSSAPSSAGDTPSPGTTSSGSSQGPGTPASPTSPTPSGSGTEKGTSTTPARPESPSTPTTPSGGSAPLSPAFPTGPAFPTSPAEPSQPSSGALGPFEDPHWLDPVPFRPGRLPLGQGKESGF